MRIEMVTCNYRRLPATVFLLAAIATAAWASPSDEKPDELLDVRNHAASKALLDEAVTLYAAIEKAVAEHETRAANDGYKAATSRDIHALGTATANISSLDRVADRLIIFGEPCGVDLKLRVKHFRKRLTPSVIAIKKAPNFNKMLPAVAKQLTAESSKGQRQLKKLGDWYKQGKVDLAEKGLYSIIEEMDPYSVWLDGSARSAAYNPFSAALRAVDEAMRKQRQEEAANVLDDLREQQLPDYEAFNTAAKTAIESVRSTGQASWNQQTLDGPDLVKALGQAWRELHNQTAQCRAVDWARNQKQGTAPPSELDKLIEAHNQFNRTAANLIAEVVAADTARANADIAVQLYPRYLAALSSLAMATGDELGFMKTVQPAVHALAEKSPALAGKVEAYQQATDEVLRWRRRVAEAQLRRQASSLKPLEVVFAEAAKSDDMQNRLLPKNTVSSEEAQLLEAAPVVVRDMSPKLIGQQALVTDVTPHADQDRSQSRYFLRQYANLPRVEFPEKKLDALRDDLLLGSNQPPLSLEAALAVSSVQAGDAQAAGVEIEGVHLDSLIVHFLSLPASATCLPVGPLPSEPARMNPVDQVLMWFDAKPLWACNAYLFAELAPQ